MTERDDGTEKGGGREFEAQVAANLTLILQDVAWLREHAKERTTPPDPAKEIAALAEATTELVEGVRQVKDSEALKSTPKAHAKLMDEAAARVAEQGRKNVEDARRTLSAATESVRETRRLTRHPYDQKAWNWGFAAGGVVVSAVLWFLATAYVIPPAYSIWPHRMMHADKLWSVGWSILGSANPGFRDTVSRAYGFYRDNTDALAACEDAARRRGTPVECRIVVSAPE